MGRFETAEFLKQVSGLLEKNEGKSSIYITQKRLSYTGSDSPIPVVTESSSFTLPKGESSTILKSEEDTGSYPLLIRVTDGNKDKKKKVKLSTVVDSDKLETFWNDYANALKNGFIGLKKKGKKKGKKSKVSKK
ncbi:hypothetical protein CANARDRAFT_176398 [[Candida] arabinofermentans NRRL YB-2248]|uniref:Signal recognition particle subunit SRP14 n=1 Tax=[Candida] arabinofermentans NRRL YB-2248 TaxID=983967 RepID=A0A1E4SZV0_9ASCO|nr:hypothetical protein CANARDRAFT_176398 [[Candida] arabinofermentans NRRL YB-2248]